MRRQGIAVVHHDASVPPLRELFGRLMATAAEADIAIARVRLSGLDLRAAELGGGLHCRVLVGRLGYASLDPPRDGSGRVQREHLVRLRDFIAAGGAEIRAAGRLEWSPDFSIFRGLPLASPTPAGSMCLVGAHYFHRPLESDGSAMTCLISEPLAVRTAADRFEALWRAGYDSGDAALDMIDRILAGLAA
jgi:hypothetical protein